MTHTPPSHSFHTLRLGFSPNGTGPGINLVFLSIILPAAGSSEGKPPQAKCYCSLLAFEVAASWAAEAAACGSRLWGCRDTEAHFPSQDVSPPLKPQLEL